MQNFIARPDPIPSWVQSFDSGQDRNGTGCNDGGVESVAFSFAEQFVIVAKGSVGPNDREGLTGQRLNFLVTIGTKLLYLAILPTNNLSEILVRMLRPDFEPTVLLRMMHGIDRLEERLRWHTAGIDAERGVIGVVAHEKDNPGAMF